MRSFMKLVLAAALSATFCGSALAATTLTVHIKRANGSPVQDVSVAAIEYGMNGPSTHTQLGLTNGSGNAVFTLSDFRGYNIMFSSHGFSPTIFDQMNNPEYDPNRFIWTNGGGALFSTFTVVQDQVNVGRIIQEYQNATGGKVLMGGLYNMLAQMPGPSAISVSSADGTGFLVVDNVPYATADTYNIGLYDPEKNRGIGRNVMADLGDGSAENPGTQLISYTGLSKLNFNQSVPPTRVETNNQPGGAVSADVNVQGVVQQLGYSTSTARYMGIGVRACIDGMAWNTWANVDENGAFKLTGLTPGNTYFVSLMGGCSWGGPEGGESICFEPYSSPQYETRDICTADHSSIDPNDIIYRNSDVMFHTIELKRMPPSIGQVRVYVRSSSGYPIPNANVNINPDGSPWPKTPTSCQTPNDFNAFFNRPGFSNLNRNASATGYALLDGLPSGNYMINVWTPFSSGGGGSNSFNQGPDGNFTAWGMNSGGGGNWQEAHCKATGVDDYRVTITTWTAETFHLYNSSGTLMRYDAGGNMVPAPGGIVDVTSITYIVSAQGADSGLVRGTLSFPEAADLTEQPIMITLYPNCGQGGCNGSGNFAVVSGSGATQYQYEVRVASGASYYMNVNAKGWGRINRGGGNNNVSLESSSTSVVNIAFAPAGIVTGTVYKPDGTVFTPSDNQYIWIDANNNNGWTGTQLQKDGTFALYDVLPGLNRFSLYMGGGPGSAAVNYAMPTPAPELEVAAGETATLNINLVNARYVGVEADLTKAPDRTIVASGYSQQLGFKAVPLPAGTVFNGETIMSMLKGGDNEGFEFRYSTGTRMGEEGPCGNSWRGGFCANAMPSPSVYDFYLMREGDFGDMREQQGDPEQAPYPHFVVLSSSKNVVVDDAHANRTVYSMGTTTHTNSGVLVDLTPATDMSNRGNATLRGRVTAANFFRQENYEACGGDMDKFMQYLPIVALYEANGAFRGAGIVVPPPAFIALKEQQNAFNSSFEQGFTQFTSLLAEAPYFGYEIRSLALNTCYTAVLTTPNYPPYQTRVCTGGNGSTTTLTMDLDSVVGSGATLQGVVRTTNSVVLANASVQLLSEGMDPKSGVTNASGQFSFPGLPPGTMRVKVSAEGFASLEDELDLTGSNVYTQNYSLTAAAGVITGTVYSQKLPYAKMQAGAQIVAYDDTYNGQNPDAPLPLIKTKTGSDGTYRLTGLVPGHVYKVFLKVTGKYTLNQTTEAVSGVQPNIDFTMLPKPLDIEMFAKKGEEYYEFTVLNPQDFKTGWAGWSASPFDGGSASTMTLTKISSGELVGKIPLSQLAPGVTYVLRGIAQSYSGKTVTRELLFGKSFKGNADQQIDDAILGDDSDDGTGRKLNEVAMDKSGDDPSGIMFPPGAVLPVSTAAVPTCSFKGEDKDDASVKSKVDSLGADAFAGGLYTLSLSSITANENKSIELTLAYDKSSADLGDLSVARYNDATGKWENYTGVATVNPVKGTVKVKLKSLASVLNTRRGSGLQVNSFDGKQYSVRPSAAGSGTSGTFAVVRPSIAGNAYAGAKLKVFNYPNPFNIKTKAVSNSQGAALNGNTEGTVIHVEVPAGNGGPGHVRIYTLAGELVNDLNTTFTAGAHNYVLWNGRNKGGQPVANGVYYGVVELSGKSPDLKDATFKMAVIK